MKDILAIKFDINMVKTRNKYFKLNTTLCFMQLELINNINFKIINDRGEI